MAEGTSVRRGEVVCRFFLASNCRDGDRCPLLHDARGVPDTICRAFLRGLCVYGQNCKYDHVGVNRENFSRRRNSDPHRIPWRSSLSNMDSPSNINRPPTPSLEPCELCHERCIDPNDEEQKKAHMEQCEKKQEENTGLLFSAKSWLSKLRGKSTNVEEEQKQETEPSSAEKGLGKTCSICLDVVLDKEPISERRFGILEKCNHVFCWSCIRTWRRSGRRENSDPDRDNARACPECRVVSHSVAPSHCFIDTEKEKRKLIRKYKASSNTRDCEYFRKGQGVCPLGRSCSYLHALPDGTKIVLPPPDAERQISYAGGLGFSPFISWSRFGFRQRSSILDFARDSDDLRDDSDDLRDDSDDLPDDSSYLTRNPANLPNDSGYLTRNPVNLPNDSDYLPNDSGDMPDDSDDLPDYVTVWQGSDNDASDADNESFLSDDSL